MSWAQCSACGETFGSDSGFDRHRIKTEVLPGFAAEYGWRCATPAEMEAAGLHRDARGWWRRQKAVSNLRVSPRSDFQGPDGSLGQGAA